MIYHSVAEIFAANDDMRARLLDCVEKLNPVQQNFRLAEGAWSIAEIVEHLCLIEGQMYALTKKLLAHAEANGVEGVRRDLQNDPVSMQQYATRAAQEKFQAPESVRPAGTQTTPESLAKMERARESLRQLQTRLEAADLSKATFPHTFFGALDLYEWLAFIGMHEARHLRQIETITAAPEFKALSVEYTASDASL